MLPNSFAWLFGFALVAVLHWALPARLRWVLLLAASFGFYAGFGLPYAGLLAAAAAAAWGFGLALQRRGGWALLATAVIVQLMPLAVFKYADFVGGMAGLPRLGWALPAGLSFYTFSALAYLIDVSRGTIVADRHLGRVALYIAFFPKLLAGPIERAGPFLTQLRSSAPFDPDRVASGLQLMLWGLAKKVLIADRLGPIVDAGFATPAFASPVSLLIAVYAYAFQIYCDFSGYSDLAIGAARVLGFELMENFRRPYLARSVAEFWTRRWHLSLMAWFRDYLYIPLGGGRRGAMRRGVNQFAVYVVSGLWHGANWTFIVWGGLNGVLHLIARAGARLRPLPGPIAVLLTFHLILLGWVFFRAASLHDAIIILTRIAGITPKLLAAYPWNSELTACTGLVAVLMITEILLEHGALADRLTRSRPLRWAGCYGLMALLLVAGRWGSASFVYMQF